MKSLATLQDRFQRGVLADDERILSDILDSPRENKSVLFGIYRSAYSSRLAEIVGHDFEQLHAYLGDEAFDAAARAYIAAHPSNQPNARWFSLAFPHFLSVTAPWRNSPELGDLAELERALNNSFDATDGPVLTLDSVARIHPSNWSKLRFVPHPSVIRLDFRTNAAAIWIALKENREPPEAMVSGKLERLLVWRQHLIPKFREMQDDEAMMWDEATADAPFGALCEMLAFHSEPESAPLRAASLLQGWIASGLVSDAQ